MNLRTLALLLVVAQAARAEEKPDPAKWGRESLVAIQRSFYMPDRALYAEQVEAGKKPSPSWAWDASVQLQALCAAARCDARTYLPQARAYAVALRSYRTTHNNLPGFDVNPGPKNPDRYYDDNAWLSLAFLETYALTRDPKDLTAATEAYRFALSGEDATTFGGGIFWHEDQTKSKNACSSGPAMLAALALYDLSGDKQYLATAERLYDWTCKTLQDTDGLVYDNISVPDGKINKGKLSYNSGTLLRAACILHRVTKEQRYLDDANKIAAACEQHFVKADDGIIDGWGKLGVKLLEGFLEMYDTTKDPRWLDVARRCVKAVHSHRNDQGWYALEWKVALPPDKPPRLIDQAAAARAYWLLAARPPI